MGSPLQLAPSPDAVGVNRAAFLLAVAVVLLGCGHVALGAPVLLKGAPDALWFTGAGLAFVLAGLLNLLGLRAPRFDSVTRAVLFGANALMTAYFAFALTLLPQPQVGVGAALFAALTVVAILPRRAAPHGNAPVPRV